MHDMKHNPVPSLAHDAPNIVEVQAWRPLNTNYKDEPSRITKSGAKSKHCLYSSPIHKTN